MLAREKLILAGFKENRGFRKISVTWSFPLFGASTVQSWLPVCRYFWRRKIRPMESTISIEETRLRQCGGAEENKHNSSRTQWPIAEQPESSPNKAAAIRKSSSNERLVSWIMMLQWLATRCNDYERSSFKTDKFFQCALQRVAESSWGQNFWIIMRCSKMSPVIVDYKMYILRNLIWVQTMLF